MRIKIIIVCALLILGLQASYLTAQEEDNPARFAINNPDGEKYEFVKVYLIGLEYIYQNDRAKERHSILDDDKMEDVNALSDEKNRLANANVNLRIARNLIRKYNQSNNGLILKAVQLFSRFTDEQLELNNRERLMVVTLYEAALNERVNKLKKEWYIEGLAKVNTKRRDSSLQLLEASTLVTKILISHQYNRLGKFYKLGITDKERLKLKRRLNNFDGQGYRGEPRAGQTFLEASVASIRQILEDKNWLTLDSQI